MFAYRRETRFSGPIVLIAARPRLDQTTLTPHTPRERLIAIRGSDVRSDGSRDTGFPMGERDRVDVLSEVLENSRAERVTPAHFVL